MPRLSLRDLVLRENRVDLADRLIETFTTARSVTATCEWYVFATIARRILELNELARQNALVAGDAAGGWSA